MIEALVIRNTASATLKKLSARAKSPRKGFERGAEAARRFLGHWFQSRGEGTWKGLAPRTVHARLHRRGYYRNRSGEGPSSRILHWTLGLRKSLTSRTFRGRFGRHVSKSQGKTRYIFGTTDSRAVFHQFGTRRMPKREVLPRRKVVPIFASAMGRWMAEAAR